MAIFDRDAAREFAKRIGASDSTIIPFPGAPRARLVWQRQADRAWRLVDQAGAVWATIEPYGDGRRRGCGMFARPTVKAIAGDYWCLASCVSQGKRRIEAALYRSPRPAFTVSA